MDTNHTQAQAAALPSAFLRRMRALLTENDYRAYLAALDLPPLRFARLNPHKPVPSDLIARELGGFPLLPPSAKPGAGALYAAGAYYVQEPAAAAVANLLPPLLPSAARVLDMCAAPGGKVTAAASARPDCVFLANEIVFSRAKILLSHVERLGLRNCTVTSLPPEEVSRLGGGLFDAVIADVPCSGEGMVRKTAFWEGDLSDDAVEACARRAADILDECDRCLRAGGLLLFCTCTFNRTENEAQVRRLMHEKGYETVAVPLPDKARASDEIGHAVRFFPQDGGGEGQFACLLRKTANGEKPRAKQARKTVLLPSKRHGAVLSLWRGITNEPCAPERLALVGDGCELLPQGDPFAAFPALRRGMRVADFSGERAVPHHHFATAADPDFLISSPDYAPESPQIAAYLAGNEFSCDAADGYRVVRTAGLPLGFVKISGGTAKNRYPKGLRRLR